MHYLIVALACSILGMGILKQEQSTDKKRYKGTLSEYGFFNGKLADLKPAKGVFSYDVNTPLFTDYAQKARFIFLPDGTEMTYDSMEVFDFPEGTTIIKNFFYFADERKPKKGKQMIETRLLIREKEAWDAVSYVWDEAQDEAYLDVAGGTEPVTFKNKRGKKVRFEYVIPNKNQCKGCHSFDGALRPIGPSARQLNRFVTPEGASVHQLKHWAEKGYLKDLPSDLKIVPKLAVWNKETSGSLDERARAWLDANCGHCHRPEGPASTSGLFLYHHETKPTALGIMKTPIAAGKGSGELDYDILPGKAKESILWYRIASTDPGIMMPELGRKLNHKEGIQLIEDWINSLK